MLKKATRALLAGAFLVLAGQAIEAAHAEYPEKPVTWLIPFGAGGGTDLWARLAGQFMNRDKISDATFIYENRTGGSGVRALTDLINREQGNDYMLMPYDNVIFAPWVQGQIPQSYKDITIIATLAWDSHVLLVKADSAIKSLDDLFAIKDHPVTLGSGPAGAWTAQILVNKSQFRPRLVKFEGDGKTLTALLGGNIDVAFANPSEALGQIQGGALRAIAFAGAERNKALPDVPTFRELGYDVVFGMPRGVAMAPGVSEQAKNYWRAKFKDLSANPSWQKDYIDRFALDGRAMDAETFVKYLESDVLPLYRAVIASTKKD